MAYSNKNILIIPNIASATDDPRIEFKGGDATTDTSIILRVLPDAGGTLSFEGSNGQLFSITNQQDGTLFAVNDISGIPSIEVLDDGAIKLAEYYGNVGIGAYDENYKLTVSGATNLLGTLDVTGDLAIGGNIITATSVNLLNTSGGSVDLRAGSVVASNNYLDSAPPNGIYSKGQIQSAVINGVAPFVIASSTVVTNLNADLLDGQEGSYYLAWANITGKPTTTSGYGITDAVKTDSTAQSIQGVKTFTGRLDTLASGVIGYWRSASQTQNYIVWDKYDDSANIAYIGADGGAAYSGGDGSNFVIRATGVLQLRSDGGQGQLNGYDIWTTGNDGAGSGLDSDLLDGQHGSYYSAWSNITGKPTTIGGYGITDAPTKTGVGASGTWSIDITGASRSVTAIDDRDVKPNTTGISAQRAIKPFFASKDEIEGAASGANFGDFLVLDTYSDSSGGTINALLFMKGASHSIFHYRANWDATTWGTPKELAYTSSNITGTASGLTTARNIALTGDVTGNANFDGTANISISATVADDSHNHTWTNITGTPTTLSGYGITDAPTKTGTGASGTWGIAITGNAGTATTLATARTIAVSGAATGTATSFNGSANISIPITAIDLTHTGLSGVIGADHLGTGTRDGTRFLRDDGVWSVVAAGGGFAWDAVVNANVATASSGVGYLMETGGTLRTVTLPSSVSFGFYVCVKAIDGDVRIISNGNIIDEVGSGNDLLINDGDTVTLVSNTAGELQILYGGSKAYTGTVTDLSVISNNGITSSVLSSSTSPQITLGLGNITPNSVAATGTITGSNLSGTNTGDQTTITGNAGTATKLQTARTINGVSFDGSANITLTASSPYDLTAGNGLTGTAYNGGVARTFTLGTPGTLTGSTTNAVTSTSHTHALSANLSAWDALSPSSKADASHTHTLDSLSNTTITLNTSGEILKWNGTAWINNTLAEAGIQPAGSYATASHTHTFASITSKPTTLTGYGITDAPTTTGTGASGTWGIAITGNAATATTLATGRTIAISGAATGSATSFNGSANISIPITAIDLTHSGISGILAPDHLGSGTRDGTKFLRDDGVWSAASGGGSGVVPWTVINTNTTISTGDRVLVTAAVDITLPSTVAGDEFIIHAKIDNVRIISNSNTITGVGAGNNLVLAGKTSVHLVASGTNTVEVI